MIHENDDILYAYLDGILTPSEIQVIEKHLEDCATCAGKIREMEELYSLLNEVEDFPMARSLVTDVVSAIDADLVIPPKLILGILVQISLASAGIVLIVLNISSLSWLTIILNKPILAIHFIRDGFLQVLSQWAFWLELIQEKWSHVLDFSYKVYLSDLPIWSLILLASIMFLVGNGLIFRKLNTNEN